MGGTIDAANVTFDSCFSRAGAGGALLLANGGRATLTQASVWSLYPFYNEPARPFVANPCTSDITSLVLIDAEVLSAHTGHLCPQLSFPRRCPRSFQRCHQAGGTLRLHGQHSWQPWWRHVYFDGNPQRDRALVCRQQHSPR